MNRNQNEWLAMTVEPTIMSDLPICDPHHHLWETYPLSTNDDGRYLLPELYEDLNSGHNIVSTVFVECSSNYRKDGPAALRPVGETEFVEAIVRQNKAGALGSTDVAAGIVGYADLTLGEQVAPVLEAHLGVSAARFKGIRQACAWDPNPDVPTYRRPPQGLMADPGFRDGFAQLGQYGLSFDAWIYHPQIPELVDLSDAFPDIPIILDHIGGALGTYQYAGRRQQLLRSWKQDIAALALRPNVRVKLGGFGMEAYGHGWRGRDKPPGSAEIAEAVRPYVEWCIEQFGVHRCMFESNFPVDKVSFSYNIMWNAYKRLAAGYSDDERAALFHDTAVESYQLAAAVDP